MYPVREVSAAFVDIRHDRQTTSTRGRKLTAQTPREANSRKIGEDPRRLPRRRQSLPNSNAVIDLHSNDSFLQVVKKGHDLKIMPAPSAFLEYAVGEFGQLQISDFNGQFIDLER